MKASLPIGLLALIVGLGASTSAQAQVDPEAPPPPAPEVPAPDPAAPPATAPPSDAQDATDDEDPNAPPKDPNAPPADPSAPPVDPNAPPPAPAAPPPEPVPPPPPPVTAPPPGPVPQAGATYTDTGPDAVEQPKKLPPRVPWRGTAITWSHSVNTTALGVGRDNIGGNGESYNMGLALLLNYFIVEGKDFRLRVTTTPGFDVELTNSDSTNTRNEPQFRDLPLQAVASLPLWSSEDKEFGASMLLNGTVLLPTSRASQEQNIYLTTSPRALLLGKVPIRGKGADFLHSGYLGLSGRWDHRFSRATTGTNDDLQRPRSSVSGGSFLSDQLSGRSIDSNAFRVGGFVFLAEEVFGRTFWLFAGAGINYRYANEFTQGCVEISTGCAPAMRGENPETTMVGTSFSAGLTYFPMVEWGVSLGYDNATGQLGPDGQRRNFFYSPDAQFSGSIVLSIDAIYERLTGPERDEPFVLFGSNEKQRKRQQQQQSSPLHGVF